MHNLYRKKWTQYNYSILKFYTLIRGSPNNKNELYTHAAVGMTQWNCVAFTKENRSNPNHDILYNFIDVSFSKW